MQALEALRDFALPASGLLLCLYPAALLCYTVAEGTLAARKGCDEACPLPVKSGGRRRRGGMLLAAAAATALLLTGTAFACGVGSVGRCAQPQPRGQVPRPSSAAQQHTTAAVLAGAAALFAAVRGGAVARGDGAEKRYTPPPPRGYSLWHDVDLKAGDEGLYHYVNEMPLGCLQKFEVQPGLFGNAVEEDRRGSGKLAAFGRPVPFNYGCFPQTYRDPLCKDEIYGAPGDDDPLDVLDLAYGAAGVGQVVRCRVLGAVCLIDGGQADWKVLAVNVDSQEPISQAKSVEEVEAIAPGRVAECLQWIDDFKQSGGKGAAHLDFQVHSAAVAAQLLREDHASWRMLLREAGAGDRARGHWVRAPRQMAKVHEVPKARKAPRWPMPALSFNFAAPWVGASPAMAARGKRTQRGEV